MLSPEVIAIRDFLMPMKVPKRMRPGPSGDPFCVLYLPGGHGTVSAGLYLHRYGRTPSPSYIPSWSMPGFPAHRLKRTICGKDITKAVLSLEREDVKARLAQAILIMEVPLP